MDDYSGNCQLYRFAVSIEFFYMILSNSKETFSNPIEEENYN
ncbi:hypothetical protein IWX80_002680 [Flavobacterium sp. CAN_S2]